MKLWQYLNLDLSSMEKSFCQWICYKGLKTLAAARRDHKIRTIPRSASGKFKRVGLIDRPKFGAINNYNLNLIIIREMPQINNFLLRCKRRHLFKVTNT